MMDSVDRILSQVLEDSPKIDIEYSRAVNMEGNTKAQWLIEKYFEKRDDFEWRGLGRIKKSALRLRDEYSSMDAEIVFKDILPKDSAKDNPACRCGDILKGVAKPSDCKVFAKVCTPQNPLGSCMVSSEGDRKSVV